jgi:hypothetical protein
MTSQCWWLTPVILAIQEAEIRRFEASSRQLILREAISKIPNSKRDSGVAQGVGPDFKPQYHKKEKKKHDWGHDL